MRVGNPSRPRKASLFIGQPLLTSEKYRGGFEPALLFPFPHDQCGVVEDCGGVVDCVPVLVDGAVLEGRGVVDDGDVEECGVPVPVVVPVMV